MEGSIRGGIDQSVIWPKSPSLKNQLNNHLPLLLETVRRPFTAKLVTTSVLI